MKKYGIYIAFSPNEKLIGQGLSEYVKRFLQEFSKINQDVFLVIACPSWHHTWVKEILENAQVPIERYEILCNRFSFLDLLLKCNQLKNKFFSLFKKFHQKASFENSAFKPEHADSKLKRALKFILRSASKPYSKISSIAIASMHLVKTYQTHPAREGKNPTSGKPSKLNYLKRYIKNHLPKLNLKLRAKRQLRTLRQILCYLPLKSLTKKINNQKDIAAWYAPHAAWRHFSDIVHSKILCVPDFVYGQFPIGFGQLLMDDMAAQIEYSIQRNSFFIVYSETSCQEVLMNRFGILENAISVIPHGTSNIHETLNFNIRDISKDGMKEKCKNMVYRVIEEKNLNSIPKLDRALNLKYVFYASQMRPNKNIFSLIKAYHLLRDQQYISHKLILTCQPNDKEILNYIHKNQLKSDILFLCGLSDLQLAACYHLAELAICPTLFEGGFPFTFEEALSVQTPVIMSNIAVTREIITNPQLQNQMLFDPYDVKSMAHKIKWGIEHRDDLLKMQLPIYHQRAKRSWGHVAQDIFEAMEKISHTQDSPV